MNEDEKFVLGEIHGMVKAIREDHGARLLELSILMREVREKGCVVGTQHALQINNHHGRIKRMEGIIWKAIVVGAVIASSILGLDKIIGVIIK